MNWNFYKSLITGTAVLSASAAGVYLPEGRHPIIPFFQHSIIPIVNAANYVLLFYLLAPFQFSYHSG
jgi:hypothetical protein